MESDVAIQAKVRAGRLAGDAELAIGMRIARELAPHEILLLLFSLLFSVISVLGANRVTEWPQVLLNMLVTCVIILAVNVWASTAAEDSNSGTWLRRVRLLYLFPLVPIYFKTAELLSYPLHGHDFDSLLITVDRMMFGVNPTIWLAQHVPAWPWLTEYMVICYSVFYFLPFALTVELYRRSRKKDESGSMPPFSFRAIRTGDRPEPVEQVVFIIVYAFLLSYLGYLFLPAIGPRFTLHNFLNLSKDQPGLWLADPFRAILNRGENIIPGMTMSEILHRVTRDAFPSGHTDITLLTILLAFQFRARVRWYLTVIGVSLIFSTVYLRYHYVIDLVGGLLMAAITLYTWEWVRERMLQIRGRFSS